LAESNWNRPKNGSGTGASYADEAFAYLRVSGLGQIDRDGFARQRESIDAYASREDVEVVAEFREEGVSGRTELDGREAMATMFKRVDEQGVKLVLVERADRIARDLMVSEVLLQQFRERGVQVIECEGRMDLTAADEEPTRVLVRQVLAAIAQFEKSCLVAKLRLARERIKQRFGRCEGRKPYGHYPNEQVVIARVKQLRRKPRGGERRSIYTVMETLNKEGFRNRKGGLWTETHVRKLVKSICGSRG
jgi:DNA invertase Pin-like site-specific DNA recombinase